MVVTLDNGRKGVAALNSLMTRYNSTKGFVNTSGGIVPLVANNANIYTKEREGFVRKLGKTYDSGKQSDQDIIRIANTIPSNWTPGGGAEKIFANLKDAMMVSAAEDFESGIGHYRTNDLLAERAKFKRAYGRDPLEVLQNKATIVEGLKAR
jgi:hypothetical protein